MCKGKIINKKNYKMYSPVLGDKGIAGLGAELEHSRPIFDGGFRPDGLVNVVGRTGVEFGIVEAVVLTVDAASDDVDDGAGGGTASTCASDFSLILMHFLHFRFDFFYLFF